MTKKGLQNESKISEILQSGSLAIKTKNNFGVHLFDAKDNEDGIITGKLTKPKYNVGEILKSVDTTIIELLPISAPELPDTVLRVIYNEALAEIAARDVTIEGLNKSILDLRAKVKELEIVSQSLRVELDGSLLNVAVAQNETQQSTTKISSTVVELQNAIQRATAESIQRVSLFARVQSLTQEVDNLREQLYGKQSKIDAGAKVTDDFSAKVVNISDAKFPDLTFRARAKDDGRGNWINGPEIEVSNFTDEVVNLTFSQDGEINGIFNSISSQTLGKGETKKITISTNAGKIDGYKPKSGFGFTGDTEYKGNVIIKSPKGTINIPVSLQKMRGNQWSG
jgi:hypothetical protein